VIPTRKTNLSSAKNGYFHLLILNYSAACGVEIEGKHKFVPVLIKHCSVRRVEVPWICRKRVVSFTPRRFTSGEWGPIKLCEEAWLSGRCGQEENFLSMSGIEFRFLSCPASPLYWPSQHTGRLKALFMFAITQGAHNSEKRKRDKECSMELLTAITVNRLERWTWCLSRRFKHTQNHFWKLFFFYNLQIVFKNVSFWNTNILNTVKYNGNDYITSCISQTLFRLHSLDNGFPYFSVWFTT
jgi:hypothetical protein